LSFLFFFVFWVVVGDADSIFFHCCFVLFCFVLCCLPSTTNNADKALEHEFLRGIYPVFSPLRRPTGYERVSGLRDAIAAWRERISAHLAEHSRPLDDLSPLHVRATPVSVPAINVEYVGSGQLSGEGNNLHQHNQQRATTSTPAPPPAVSRRRRTAQPKTAGRKKKKKNTSSRAQPSKGMPTTAEKNSASGEKTRRPKVAQRSTTATPANTDNTLSKPLARRPTPGGGVNVLSLGSSGTKPRARHRPNSAKAMAKQQQRAADHDYGDGGYSASPASPAHPAQTLEIGGIKLERGMGLSRQTPLQSLAAKASTATPTTATTPTAHRSSQPPVGATDDVLSTNNGLLRESNDDWSSDGEDSDSVVYNEPSPVAVVVDPQTNGPASPFTYVDEQEIPENLPNRRRVRKQPGSWWIASEDTESDSPSLKRSKT
jgi:hypothetical protein